MDENHIKSILCLFLWWWWIFPVQNWFCWGVVMVLYTWNIAKNACIRVVSPHLVLPNSSPIWSASTFLSCSLFCLFFTAFFKKFWPVFRPHWEQRNIRRSKNPLRTSHVTPEDSKTFPQTGTKLEPWHVGEQSNRPMTFSVLSLEYFIQLQVFSWNLGATMGRLRQKPPGGEGGTGITHWTPTKPPITNAASWQRLNFCWAKTQNWQSLFQNC